MDERQFQKIYDATKKQLWSYIMRVSGDPALADDILQDTYIRFLQSEGSALEESKMKPYLFTVATNLLRDHWRKAKRKRAWLIDHVEEEKQMPDRSGLRYDVEEAFRHLTPQQRSLTWLAYVEGYEHREIAKMLNVREKSVKVLLFRAKGRLIEVFKKLGISQEITV